MHCSSVFVSVLVANLALCGATFQGNPIPNHNNGPPPFEGTVITNFGNGNGRVNEVILSGGRGYAKSQPNSDNLGNRFGEEIHIHGGRPGYQGTVISNVGNGDGNRNTIVSGSGQGTVYTRMGTNGGTTFKTRNGNEPFIYNVGMGKDNHNIITHNGKPVVPQNTDSRGSTYYVQRPNGESRSIYVSNTGCYGNSCDRRIVSSAAQTNQPIYLLFVLLSNCLLLKLL